MQHVAVPHGPDQPEREAALDDLAAEPAGDHEAVAGLLLMTDGHLARIEAELAPGEPAESAGQLARRLEVDAKIVALLRGDGFEGERFKALARRLFAYGWPIIRTWMRSGAIFTEAERFRTRVPRSSARSTWSDEEVKQLTTDTTLAGLDFFTDYGLRRGHWDPKQGASLRTYYVGSCTCVFPKVYNTWCKEQSLANALESYGPGEDESELVLSGPMDRMMTDPARNAILQDQVARAVAPMADPQLRQLVGYQAIGYSQREAAALTGLTAKAAERRLARYREKLRRDEAPDGKERSGEL